jgi:hypothetical protein
MKAALIVLPVYLVVKAAELVASAAFIALVMLAVDRHGYGGLLGGAQPIDDSVYTGIRQFDVWLVGLAGLSSPWLVLIPGLVAAAVDERILHSGG